MLCPNCGHENALRSAFCNACGAGLGVHDAATESAETPIHGVSANFVGRRREMGELRAALEDSLSGQGRMLALVGEPGIGKTKAAGELAAYAGLRGAQVLWGRCYEDVGAPPHWPWVQAIRSYVRERDPEQLRSEMGAGAADIAGIVSDVRESLPDLKPPTPLEDPDQERFRLLDSMTAFLRSASNTLTVVLILEDLHWADRPSLLLLEHVARELSGARLLLVGTYRDVELGRRHPLAWSLCDYADALLERARAGDREKAISHLDESLSPSTELGMRHLMERVAAHQEKAESRPAKAPAYPDSLTQREVEVLRLVAAGKTNQLIADELFITLRTVANHVTSILTKTDSANRTEAAMYATRQGLTQ